MVRYLFFKLATFTLTTLVTRAQEGGQCVDEQFQRGFGEKEVYEIGVLAIRGVESAYAEFNATFSDYLTATAGRRFNPPIRFQMRPLNFIQLFDDTESGSVDLFYVNPSAYSCIESEYGARSLASQISKRVVGGNVYQLTEFGGVIFTLHNSSVNTIADIKGKSTAAASVSGLGSGQMQARELIKAGISYMNDPKQIVYTSNQGKVVQGVLKGEFDVGFVRTDQLERTMINEEPVDLNLFKIIDAKPGLESDGVPFPFKSSTPLYPEWNLAALNHVPNDVSIAVQEAMYSIENHAIVGSNLDACYVEKNCTGNHAYLTTELCFDSCNSDISLNDLQCDTTIETALLAHYARSNGKYTGWRSTLSYMELRNMQEETNFIRKSSKSGAMQCVRSKRIYDAVTCPAGHFKKSEEDVLNGCADAGLPCSEGYQCLCTPCVQGYDVNIMPQGTVQPCAKFTDCGYVEQLKYLTFIAVDNKQRDNIQISVTYYDDFIREELVATPSTTQNFTYLFTVSGVRVGTMILEVFVGEEQISESPLRVVVESRNCAEDFQDLLRTPTESGECVCQTNSVEMGGNCVSYSIIFPSIFVPLAVVSIFLTCVYVQRKRKAADSVWAVKVSELNLTEPPVILGRGTFGLVLLAEYRGTMVALKRVIPPKPKQQPALRGSGSFKRLDALRRPSVDSFTTETGSGNGDKAKDIENGKKNDITQPPHQKMGRRASIDHVLKDLDEDVEAGKVAVPKVASTNKAIEGMKSGAFQKQDSFAWKGSGSGSMVKDTEPGVVRRLSNLFSSADWFSKDEYAKLKADFIIEMRHLSKLRHPCITTVMGAVISKKEEPMLVMEYMQLGSLYDMLHNETMEIDGELVLPILRDIAQGVRFLHTAEPQVIHGDLKAQNVLVDNKFHAKVADFGLSQKKKVGATGTPYWMAPELLRGDSSNTAASDIYSFGIILCEVYSRKDPYSEDEDYREVLKLVADPTVNKRPKIPPNCSPEVVSLTHECLVGEAEKRPTSQELDQRLKRLDASNVEPGQMVWSFQKKKEKKEKMSSDMIYSNFPKHVADAIMAGKKVEPESFPEVTIFFSDIVGFTTISSKITPTKVSNMLDRLYLKFDELSDKYDIFKIETIGDAYMCVTNLMRKQPDHTKRITLFALESIKAANSTYIDEEDPSMGCVNIRVGFHSGPVVANVVGSRNLKYSIFGDTVNTASRMESNSEKNRIQCSEAAALLLKRQDPNIPLYKRRPIQIKGKGEMQTYWVNEMSERPST